MQRQESRRRDNSTARSHQGGSPVPVQPSPFHLPDTTCTLPSTQCDLHPSIYPMRPSPFRLPDVTFTLPSTRCDLHPSIYPICIRRVTIYVSLSANRTQPIVLSTIQQRKQWESQFISRYVTPTFSTDVSTHSSARFFVSMNSVTLNVGCFRERREQSAIPAVG